MKTNLIQESFLPLPILQPPLLTPPSSNQIQATASKRATFRKFMAEAPIRVNEWSLKQVCQEPTIHFSDSSGELRKKFIESIREAKKSIEIMTFTFSDSEIIQLLLQKVKEGVQVTIAIDKDHMGSLLPHKDLIKLITRNAGDGRVHHKLMAIDGETVWIGSANFSPEALLKQNNTMVQTHSKELAQAIHEEIGAFSGICKRDPKPLPPFEVEGQTLELLFFPHVPFGVLNSPEKAINDAGKQRIIEMINEAKKSLRFAICVWTDPDLAKAVINAKNRGVDVQVILWKKAESAEIAKLFEQENIKVIEKPHLSLMHNKWMFVDEQQFLNCSANWSKSWFSRNDESALIIQNVSHTQKQGLNDYWDQLLNA